MTPKDGRDEGGVELPAAASEAGAAGTEPTSGTPGAASSSEVPRLPLSQSQQGTDTRLDSASWARQAELRVPGLTILWHTDCERVGERVPLPELAAGNAVPLGRMAPLFLDRQSGQRRPLADARISRAPLRFLGGGISGGGRSPGGLSAGGLSPGGSSSGPADGGIRVERAGSRTPTSIDGVDLGEARELTQEELARGVVILLGGRVVLLLHLLDPSPPSHLPSHGMIGESPAMIGLREEISRLADLSIAVLLRGETGTGKELAAQALHRAGPRSQGPFEAVNMAAIPPTLAATELFGSAKGAFTGAHRHRAGCFQRAHGGTLFLDEIGETPSEVQPMLLRAVETGKVRAVGADTSSAVDVRLISATDLDLERAVQEDRFRAPLLHRLSGFVLRLPALRERREDFGRLLVSFLRRALAELGEGHRLGKADRPWLPAAVVARLALYSWPGNIRQLENVIRQLAIANRGQDQATVFGPAEELLGAPVGGNPLGGPAALSPPPTPSTSRARESVSETVRAPKRPADVREDELLAALERNRYRPKDAAEDLGIPRSSLYELMAKSPRVRKASDLGQAEIDAALEAHGGSTEAAAEALRVSAQALRRQMGKLEPT